MTTTQASTTTPPTDVRCLDGHTIHPLPHPGGYALYQPCCDCGWAAGGYTTPAEARVQICQHAYLHTEPGVTTADTLTAGDWFTIPGRTRPHTLHVLQATPTMCGRIRLHLPGDVSLSVRATQPVLPQPAGVTPPRRACSLCHAAQDADCEPWCPNSPLTHLHH